MHGAVKHIEAMLRPRDAEAGIHEAGEAGKEGKGNGEKEREEGKGRIRIGEEWWIGCKGEG